jgi:hypothetical protein
LAMEERPIRTTNGRNISKIFVLLGVLITPHYGCLGPKRYAL